MNQKLVEVTLNDDFNKKKYTFIDHDNITAVNDLVVVDTCNGFKLGRVVSMEGSKPKNRKLRDIVDVVDTFAFDDRCRNRERAEELKSKMNAKVKDLQTLAIYETLAKEDPELADMLAEYKTLV